MKAGLKLTRDQEKLWGPFEAAVRDSQRDRLDEMQKTMEMRHGAEPMSPVDLMDAWSNRLMQAATDMKKVADAAKPLYASLDDTQKHAFVRKTRAFPSTASSFCDGAALPRVAESGDDKRRVIKVTGS